MNELTILDVILLWDKILTADERETLLYRHYPASDEAKNNTVYRKRHVRMNAENMNPDELNKIHTAMILSSITRMKLKQLVKFIDKVKVKWDLIRFRMSWIVSNWRIYNE